MLNLIEIQTLFEKSLGKYYNITLKYLYMTVHNNYQLIQRKNQCSSILNF